MRDSNGTGMAGLVGLWAHVRGGGPRGLGHPSCGVQVYEQHLRMHRAAHIVGFGRCMTSTIFWSLCAGMLRDGVR